MFYGQTSLNLTFLLEITDAVSSLKRRETFCVLSAFSSRVSISDGMGVHIVWAACMFWKALWMLKGVYKGFRAIYSPPDDASISGKALCISAGTMQNHILQLLQQHGFIVEESGGWIGCLQSRSFTYRKHLAHHYERRLKLFSSWKPISGKNVIKFQHQNSRISMYRCLQTVLKRREDATPW